MSRKEEPTTLADALMELMRLIRSIDRLQKQIDEQYGVRLVTGYVPGIGRETTGDVTVRRGIEEVEKAIGKEAKRDGLFNDMRMLRHYGIEFRQYADPKTKVFVKAYKEAPVPVIEEDER